MKVMVEGMAMKVKKKNNEKNREKQKEERPTRIRKKNKIEKGGKRSTTYIFSSPRLICFFFSYR